MNMNSYKSAMEKISADEYAIRRIVSAAAEASAPRPKKQRVFRRAPALLAAAVIALSLGAAAYAASTNVLSVIFGEGDYEGLENLTGEMKIRDLKVNSEGISVHPEGYATDGYKAYCVFRIDFDEPLPELEANSHFTNKISVSENGTSYSSDMDWKAMTEQIKAQGLGWPGLGAGYKEAEGNSLYSVLYIELDELAGCSVDIDYNCVGLGYTRMDPENRRLDYAECIGGSLFEADITIDMEMAETVKLNPEGTKYKNWDFTLTSCGVYVTGTFFSSVSSPFPFDCEQYILMKDGSKVDIPNGFNGGFGPSKEWGDTRRDYRYTAMAELPFNVNEAVALVVDGTVIPIASE